VLPQLIGDKERFIISHGSYQNRWKLSITPDRKVRWTIKNSLGQIRDLDSETILEEEKNYHIGVTYDASFMMLYINGRLETFTTLTGNINESPFALEIGQQLPDDPSYNFRGVLDEIKIFNYALWPDSVIAESGFITYVNDINSTGHDGIQIFPNPANGSLTIDLADMKNKINPVGGIITILDMWGREVFTSTFGESLSKTIYFPSFYPGSYILKLSFGEKSYLKKLIIQ
jgi:hypothetical protein